MNYNEILSNNNLKITNNIIYKTGKNNKNRPICNNDILQHLVLKYQDNDGILSTEDDYMFGCCLQTLIKIVLNNAKFRYQDEIIRSDIRTEAYCDILTALKNKLFDQNKGKAYSYCFRLAYVAGIHILQQYNIIREHETELDDNMANEIDEDLWQN